MRPIPPARSSSPAPRPQPSGAVPGQRVIIDVPAQSVQPETQTFIAGISASDTLYTSGNVRFTGVGGGITVSSNTGQRVDLSVAAQSVQPETQTFVAGIQNSQTTYTSGTVNLSVNGGLLTIRSTTGQAFQFSVSQSVQPETQTAISGIANSQTTYTSGTVSLSELGAITIRSTTGNQFQFSVNSQTAQTGISGIANSQTTYTSGTVSLSELGAITIRSTTGNQYQLSVNSQTVQTQGILSAGVSTGGNTAGNTQVSTGSRLVLVGTNNITLSQGTAAGATTITISGPTTAAQSVQTQGILNVALSNIGNTAGDTGINSGTRMVLAGGNNVTLSASSAANATTVTISAAAQSVQTQGILSAGVSTGGNTAGNTTVNTGSRLVIVGSNGITASQGTAAGATTITLSGATQTVQTQDVLSVGVSTGGNTAGNTTVNTGSRLVLVGSGNLTASQGTAAGATTVTLSVATQTVQTQSLIQALYDGANSITTGTVRLTNANGVTFSVNAQTLSASVNQSISMHAVSNTTQSTSGTAHKSALSFGGAGIASGRGHGWIGGYLGSRQAGAWETAACSRESRREGTRRERRDRSTGNFVLVGNSPISLSQATVRQAAATVSINAPATSSLSATGLVSISTNGSTISIGVPGTAAATGRTSRRVWLRCRRIARISKTPFYWHEIHSGGSDGQLARVQGVDGDREHAGSP